VDFTPPLRKYAYENFESRFKIASLTNPRGLAAFDSKKQARRQKAIAPITEAQMRRGADGHTFRWVTTLFPTAGYAMEAGMSTGAYEDFVYRACHVDEKTPDPVAYWQSIEEKQRQIVHWLEGKNQVVLQGPNVDLTLSIKGRRFMNSCGTHNMPDGEVYTGPVEESVNGWVKFTYPAIYSGVAVEGIELNFTNGKVVTAKADKNQQYLMEMLDLDAGSRYLGEFAIGTNFEIDRFTGNILFDEKIGGTFHMALGAGYPETGSKNRSSIHWDMICDMRTDATITVDGELLYEDGQFVI
jgi:aminopeptidase